MTEKISYEALSSPLRNREKSSVALNLVMRSRGWNAEVNPFGEILAVLAPTSY